MIIFSNSVINLEDSYQFTVEVFAPRARVFTLFRLLYIF